MAALVEAQAKKFTFVGEASAEVDTLYQEVNKSSDMSMDTRQITLGPQPM